MGRAVARSALKMAVGRRRNGHAGEFECCCNRMDEEPWFVGPRVRDVLEPHHRGSDTFLINVPRIVQFEDLATAHRRRSSHHRRTPPRATMSPHRRTRRSTTGEAEPSSDLRWSAVVVSAMTLSRSRVDAARRAIHSEGWTRTYQRLRPPAARGSPATARDQL